MGNNDSQKLSLAAKDKLVGHVRAKAPGLACSVCQSKSFQVLEHLTAAAIASPDGVTHLGGEFYPLASLVCSNCFHVIPFLALPIGLMDEKTPPDGGENVFD